MKNEGTESQSESIQQLGKLIEGVQVAMFTSLNTSGDPHTRPMATVQMDSEWRLWFFTRQHSAKVEETQKDHRVTVAYSDPARNRYVCVGGYSNLVKDKDKMKELWNPLFKAWFPDGLEDPEIALLRVDPETAEYWDSPSSTMVKLMGFAKAVITGKPYEGGNHGTLNVAAS